MIRSIVTMYRTYTPLPSNRQITQYRAVVKHRRLNRPNQTTHRITMDWFDLETTSENNSVITNFQKSDFTSAQELKDFVNQSISQQLSFKSIHTLANLRSWGYVFNPIALHFLVDERSSTHLVAEVTNTPWLERTLYYVKENVSIPKQMHVSPFNHMEQYYVFNYRETERTKTMFLQVHNSSDDEKIMETTLHCYDPYQSDWWWLRSPRSATIWLFIRLDALRLYIKKNKLYVHPTIGKV